MLKLFLKRSSGYSQSPKAIYSRHCTTTIKRKQTTIGWFIQSPAWDILFDLIKKYFWCEILILKIFFNRFYCSINAIRNIISTSKLIINILKFFLNNV